MLNYKYKTLTLADIFGVDKAIPTLTYDDMCKLTYPHKPIVKIHFNGKILFAYKEDAEKCGYEYEEWESFIEKEAKEKMAKEAKWQKEYQQRVKNGEANQPFDIDKKLSQLSKQYHAKYSNQERQKQKEIDKVKLKVIRENEYLFKTNPTEADAIISDLISVELEKQKLL